MLMGLKSTIHIVVTRNLSINISIVSVSAKTARIQGLFFEKRIFQQMVDVPQCLKIRNTIAVCRKILIEIETMRKRQPHSESYVSITLLDHHRFRFSTTGNS